MKKPGNTTKKNLNTNKIYQLCLTEKTAERITARTVYDYCVSPFMVHCNKYAPADMKDPENRYNELLFEQGREHEKQIIQTNYPTAKQIQFATREEGFRLLLAAMAKGTKVLCGLPAFYLPQGLEGVFDILEKRTSQPSALGNYHYIVKEVKLARNIQQRHIQQAAFYNYLLGKIQKHTPSEYYVINRDGIEQEIQYDEKELLTILEDIRAIHEGKQVLPTYGACHWPWQTYNNEEAKRIRDVSLVSGVGASFKTKLLQQDINTVEDLAKTTPETLCNIRGIGEKTAQKFHQNANALANGTHIRIGTCSFPKKQTEIFLDLEGTGEQTQDSGLVVMDYLIGVIVRTAKDEKYIPFTAHAIDQEQKMFREFVDWTLRQEDYVIYHWHHYEKTHLKKLAERHGLTKETAPILDHMQDLYKTATDTFAFPTFGNGLKVVAAYIGFKWKQQDVNALESIALYFEYIQNPTKNKEKLDKIIAYNEDDCKATLLIKDWLEKQSETSATIP